jgi:eukaryotic-like serine/threonine-protein kinase
VLGLRRIYQGTLDDEPVCARLLRTPHLGEVGPSHYRNVSVKAGQPGREVLSQVMRLVDDPERTRGQVEALNELRFRRDFVKNDARHLGLAGHLHRNANSSHSTNVVGGDTRAANVPCMPQHPQPLTAGTTLHDRYEIVGYLGGGKYGQVHKVHDHNLGCDVALKLLEPLAGESLDWAEAQRLQQLRSEFLLPVLNAAVIPGLDLRYITMPLAEEGDLARMAGELGAPLLAALRLCQQVATGAARIHDAGLLHRDVKPENVFLSRGDALLGDLGLAALMDGAGTAAADGTQFTAAPELFQGGRCSVRSEVYSLGATTYIALTGKWPRGHGLGPVEVARAAIAGAGPDLRDLAPHVPRAVASVVSRALAVDPAKRYSTAAGYGAALGEAAKGVAREWQRTDEHGDHAMCVRAAAKKGRSGVFVCLAGVGALREIRVTTTPGGRRLGAKEPAPTKPSQALAAMRRVITHLD